MRLIKLFSLAGIAACWSNAAVTSSQEREWRSEIRAALRVPDKLPPLDAEVHGRFHPEPGIVAERVTYSTLLGLQVPAILYLPESRKGKIPLSL
jgi:hypothetical protein